MEKKTIVVNLDTLKALITKHSVETYLLGLAGHVQMAINAATLFPELDTCADCPKDEFVTYVNAMSSKDWQVRDAYVRIPEVDILFQKVQFPGIFQVKGHENLGSDPFIMHKDIKHVIGV